MMRNKAKILNLMFKNKTKILLFKLKDKIKAKIKYLILLVTASDSH